MQYQVPQFIETEDKIVGPLSLRQFMYVAAGVGLSGLLYFVLQTWLWAILSILIVGSTGAIAFVRVQGRPLTRIVASAFHYYWRPQTYVWKPAQPKINMPAEIPHETPSRPLIERVAEGMALHKTWENVQTGEKISDRQFTEKKMYGRYQIFQKMEGDRQAARRVDYR